MSARTNRKLVKPAADTAPKHHEPATGTRDMKPGTFTMPLFRELTAYALESSTTKYGAALACGLLGVGTDDRKNPELTRSWWAEVLAAVVGAIESLTDTSLERPFGDWYQGEFAVRECAVLCRWAFEVSEFMRLSFENERVVASRQMPATPTAASPG